MFVVRRQVIGNAGHPCMDIAATETFRIDILSRSGFYERRSAEKNRSLIAHDDRLIAHRRYVSAARRTRTHHDRDLWNTQRRHRRLVIEDPTEVLFVREYLILHRQKRTARIDEIDARQEGLERYFLRAQMLLYRDRVIGAALDRCVVDDDDTLAPRYPSNSRNDSGARYDVVIQLMAGQLSDFEKRRARIEQTIE